MSKNMLLRIDSSARGEGSISRQLTAYTAAQLSAADNTFILRHHDVGNHPLPQLGAEQLVGIHGSVEGGDLELQQLQALSDQFIGELMATRVLVIGAPVYNFGIPATLKQWIDMVCRARKTFRYTENGPEGLTGVEQAIVIASSGGTPIGSDFEFVSPYLRQVLGFIGVKQIHVIDASGSMGDAEATLAKARKQIDQLIPQIAGEVLKAG